MWFDFSVCVKLLASDGKFVIAHKPGTDSLLCFHEGLIMPSTASMPAKAGHRRHFRLRTLSIVATTLALLLVAISFAFMANRSAVLSGAKEAFHRVQRDVFQWRNLNTNLTAVMPARASRLCQNEPRCCSGERAGFHPSVCARGWSVAGEWSERAVFCGRAREGGVFDGFALLAEPAGRGVLTDPPPALRLHGLPGFFGCAEPQLFSVVDVGRGKVGGGVG